MTPPDEKTPAGAPAEGAVAEEGAPPRTAPSSTDPSTTDPSTTDPSSTAQSSTAQAASPSEPPPPDAETARVEAAPHAIKSTLPGPSLGSTPHTPSAREAPVETSAHSPRAGTREGTLPTAPESVTLAPAAAPSSPAPSSPAPSSPAPSSPAPSSQPSQRSAPASQGSATQTAPQQPASSPPEPPLTVGLGRVRAFIALNFPLAVVRTVMDEVAQQRPRLAQAGLDVAWVPAANVHLTLKFLGSVPREAIEAIAGRLRRELVGKGPFELEAKGLGAFPSLEQPKVLWVGVKPHPALAALARDVDAWMEAVGVPREERAYHPHLTVGRVKGGGASLVEAWKPRENTVFGSGRVNEVVLYESRTHRAGAEYVALARVPLGTAAKK